MRPHIKNTITDERAAVLLSQMFLPNFDDEEKDALRHAISILWENVAYKARTNGNMGKWNKLTGMAPPGIPRTPYLFRV